MKSRPAPKGRIKGPTLMDAPSLMDAQGHPPYVPCAATSKQSGQRCRRRPIPGGTVCVMHGGKTPVIAAKARERLIALQHPAIDTLSYLMDQRSTFPSTAYAAARDVLDRTEGKAVETIRQDVTINFEEVIMSRLANARKRIA